MHVYVHAHVISGKKLTKQLHFGAVLLTNDLLTSAQILVNGPIVAQTFRNKGTGYQSAQYKMDLAHDQKLR